MLGLVGSGRIGLKVVLEWVAPPQGAPRPPGVALERGLLVPRSPTCAVPSIKTKLGSNLK